MIHALVLGFGLPVAGVAATVGYAFRTCDGFGKTIVLILLGGSVFAWSVMITKMNDLRRARADSHRFLEAYRAERNPLQLFVQQRVYSGPLYAVYQEVCRALGSETDLRHATGDFLGGTPATRMRLTPADAGLARQVAERSSADLALLLESNMGFLAVVVAAAPFLGLLGTVWGVMDAFRAMAVQGTVMLSEVAPGISGALLTTVVGLLVALPSLIGYNLLTSQLRHLGIEMENFTEQLTHDIDRSLQAGR